MVSSSGTIATKMSLYAPEMFEVCKKDLECFLFMTAVNKTQELPIATVIRNKRK